VEDDNRWRRTMEREIGAEELREVAHFVEESLVALADISDISFPLVSGDLRRFPRQTAEGEAFEQGVEFLREDAEEALASLRALAVAQAAVEQDPERALPVPPALFASVRPYIEEFRRAEGQPPSENGPNQTEGNTTT
jgi:hypothetical protein